MLSGHFQQPVHPVPAARSKQGASSLPGFYSASSRKDRRLGLTHKANTFQRHTHPRTNTHIHAQLYIGTLVAGRGGLGRRPPPPPQGGGTSLQRTTTTKSGGRTQHNPWAAQTVPAQFRADNNTPCCCVCVFAASSEVQAQGAATPHIPSVPYTAWIQSTVISEWIIP